MANATHADSTPTHDSSAKEIHIIHVNQLIDIATFARNNTYERGNKDAKKAALWRTGSVWALIVLSLSTAALLWIPFAGHYEGAPGLIATAFFLGFGAVFAICTAYYLLHSKFMNSEFRESEAWNLWLVDASVYVARIRADPSWSAGNDPDWNSLKDRHQGILDRVRGESALMDADFVKQLDQERENQVKQLQSDVR
jgi:hypothetical protein